MKKSLVSWTLLFACNLMWSLQFTCIKLVQDQVGAFSTVFIPMLLATIFMVPFVYKDVQANKKRKFSARASIVGRESVPRPADGSTYVAAYASSLKQSR